MATRQKTLWFATKLVADVADATVTNLDQITLYAEAGRTFRSVQVWVYAQDIVTVTGGTVGEYRCGLRLAAAAYTTITELDDVVNSGENMSFAFGPFDFTSHFTTNFGAGSSQTCDIQVYFDQTTGTTLGMRNVWALIAMTYDYDDTTATQYQTAIIPLESPTAALATSETEIGTNQIPQLTGAGGLLENMASVVVRDQFFVVEGNEANNNATTDWVLSVRIDSGTTLAFGTQESALATDRYCWWLHKETPSAGSAHAFKAWVSTGAVTRLNHAVITMFVTYEFAISGTTEMLNSLLIPLPNDNAGITVTNATADRLRIKFAFPIMEPTTITLKQSAVRMACVRGGTPVVAILAGSQTARVYTANLAGATAGDIAFQQRIDSGGAQGAGISIARGWNTFTVDVHRNASGSELGIGWHGLLLLNYKSGVASAGVGAHNHTVWFKIADNGTTAFAVPILKEYSFAAVIPETDYWLTSYGIMVCAREEGTSDAELWMQTAASEGWRKLMNSGYRAGDQENSPVVHWSNVTPHFKRWPGDTDVTRFDPETTRDWLWFQGSGTGLGSYTLGISGVITYHALTWTVSGTVSGSGGGTVDWDAHVDGSLGALVATGEKIASGSRSGNGTYSFTWFDNTQNIQVRAREDATHVGASDVGVGA